MKGLAARQSPHLYIALSAFAALALLALSLVSPAEFAFLPALASLAYVGTIAVMWPLELLATLYPFAWQIFELQIPMPFVDGYTMSSERLISAITLVGLAIGVVTRRLRLPSVAPAFQAAAAVLLFPYVLGLLHPDQTGGFSVLIQIAQKIGVGLLVFIAASDEHRLKIVTRTLIYGAILSAISVVTLVLAGQNLDAIYLTRSGELLDMSNSFNLLWVYSARSAHLGQFGVWLCFVEMELARTRRTRWLWGITAAAMLIAQTLVLRRIVLLGAALGLLFLALYGNKKIKGTAALILGAVIAMFLIVILPNSPLWQFRLGEESVQAVSLGLDPRTELLNVSWTAWLESPIWGNGLGQFENTVARYGYDLRVWQLGAQPIAPHNSFSAVSVELGGVGLLGMLGFIIVLMWEFQVANRGVALSRSAHSFNLAAKLISIWPLMFGQVLLWWWFGHGLYLNLGWYLLGMLAGAAGIVRRQGQQGKPHAATAH